ncbi:glycoside hydrolase family 2 protein [Pinibacter aurantiacus]|uniref:Beta-galactosidase n=1 Tax=Pinibacter aurantiacus TaxID=2851599 RepID=A0A9E2W7A6_9BACT|nr:sugar-binding domain-containing protein [Pinibacter aurantiacus]MBV4355907.1 hypothetical protein [Pinibacter aurantiacus]
MKIFKLLTFVLLATSAQAQKITFTHEFAPSEHYTKSSEQPYRDDICLNGSWKFLPIENATALTKEQLQQPSVPQNPQWETTPVKVPSPWNVNSFAKEEGGGDFITYPSYPQKWNDTRAGWLMRSFSVKKQWKGKRLILHFDAVAGYTQVFVNGKKAAQNYEVFLPFEADITDLVKQDGENELMVYVADADLFNQPGKYGNRLYIGGSFWGQHINGIWQDVYLLVKPEVYVKNAYIKPFVDKDLLQVSAVIKNNSAKNQSINIGGDISPWINVAGKSTEEAPEPKWKLNNVVLQVPRQNLALKPGEEKTVTIAVSPKQKLKLWSNDDPALYALVLNIKKGKDTLDKQYNRFGWREFKVVGNKFYLNGNRVILNGDSWHFMGVPQMTRRYAWAWYSMLKDAHANAVRLHAQPYPSFYLDMADEMGMFVLDETGLWASDGGPKEDAEEYWTNAADHLRRLILRDRNHPSVFGWSVCNENIPVTAYVHQSPENLVKKQLDEINNWVDIAKQLDSTRNWISGDGETGKPTNLPLIIGHYGDEYAYKEWSSQGKLWGVGECGMAYYGTPKQTSAYNDNRSYQSQQGRMEGVAAEATRLVNGMKKYDASYRSVFNIVWYGLKPLPFGLKDTTKAPSPASGVFFAAFRENQPGMQPERLGPYTSTLNPGYDASLPVYETWPLFDAIKKSFAAKDSVAEIPKPEVAFNNDPVSSKYNNLLFLSADPSGKMDSLFKNLGLNFSAGTSVNKNTLLIIDGMYPPVDDASVSLCKAVAQNGGTVFIAGANASSNNVINKYLPYSATIVNRSATSFTTNANDAAITNLHNSDFYFSELTNESISKYAIDGDIIQHSKVLLTASNTNWKMWNNKPEYSKTVSVVRSERESKEAGNSFISLPYNNGSLYFLSVNPFNLYNASPNILYKMLLNMGVEFTGHFTGRMPAINTAGLLQNAMLIDSANGGKNSEKIITATNDVLNFSAANNSGLHFWLYSPRSLSNLLVEPDMPVLNMNIKADQETTVFLNNSLLGAKSFNQFNGVPLEKGWNHIVIKTKSGDNKIGVRFESSDRSFLRKLESKVSNR